MDLGVQGEAFPLLTRWNAPPLSSQELNVLVGGWKWKVVGRVLYGGDMVHGILYMVYCEQYTVYRIPSTVYAAWENPVCVLSLPSN